MTLRIRRTRRVQRHRVALGYRLRGTCIGRRRIAEVIRDAEVAESVATSQAKQSEAESHQVGEVARQTAQTAIVQAENGLRQLRAQLEAAVKALPYSYRSYNHVSMQKYAERYAWYVTACTASTTAFATLPSDGAL